MCSKNQQSPALNRPILSFALLSCAISASLSAMDEQGMQVVEAFTPGGLRVPVHNESTFNDEDEVLSLKESTLPSKDPEKEAIKGDEWKEKKSSSGYLRSYKRLWKKHPWAMGSVHAFGCLIAGALGGAGTACALSGLGATCAVLSNTPTYPMSSLQSVSPFHTAEHSKSARVARELEFGEPPEFSKEREERSLRHFCDGTEESRLRAACETGLCDLEETLRAFRVLQRDFCPHNKKRRRKRNGWGRLTG